MAGLYSRSQCSTCKLRIWTSNVGDSEAVLCGRCKLGLPALDAATCGICLDSIEERIMFRNFSNHSWDHRRCSHLRSFCSDCMRGHVASRIGDNSWNIRCPFVGQNDDRCPYVMVEADLLMVLSRPEDKQLLNQYEKLRMADHGEYLREILSSHSSSRSKSDSSSDSTQLDSEVDSDLESTGFENWAGNSCQACPRCLVVVRKEDGCNHMVCRCGTDFCFRCGGPYSESIGPPCVCSAMDRNDGCARLGFWLRYYKKLGDDQQVDFQSHS